MERIPEGIKEDYRVYHTDRFLLQLMKTLNSPTSAKDVSEGIDKTVSMLQEFIKKRVKNIHSSPEFQKQTFEDVCLFLNSLTHNFKVKKFHNSIPKTSLKDYKKKSIGEQFIHNAYKLDWEFDTDCKGGNCSYWTISLYQFFEALKKAGLNIDIKIYRLKDVYDNFAGIAGLRHSGLIINFNGEDYLCDYDGINFIYGDGNTMIQSLKVLKGQANAHAAVLASKKFQAQTNYQYKGIIDVSALDELDSDNRYLWHSRSEEYTKTLLFDNEDSFIKDVEKYPGPQRIKFHSPVAKNGKYQKIVVEFLPGGINFITNDNHETLYVLKEDAILDSDPEEFFENLVSQLKYAKVDENVREITEAEQEYLLKNLEYIRDDLDISRVMKRCAREETEVKKRRAGIIPALGNLLKTVKERYKSLVH